MTSQGLSETHMLPPSSKALNACPASIPKFGACLPTKSQSRTSSRTTGKRGGGGDRSCLAACTPECLQTGGQPAALPAGSPRKGLPALLFPKMGLLLRGRFKSRFPHSSVNQCLVVFARMKKEGAFQYCFTAKLSLTHCISYLAEPDTAKNCHNLRKSNHTVNIHLHIKQGSNCKSHRRRSPGSSSYPCNPALHQPLQCLQCNDPFRKELLLFP